MIAQGIVSQARAAKRLQLTEIESKALLKAAGIPVIEAVLARSKKEAVSLSRQIGFPVVLKISSPDITHKSDFGGVKLGLQNATRVGQAYSEILATAQQKFPRAKLEGVSVQKMSPAGIEVIIGMSTDPQFGPVLMFGLGGILVELLKDVSFRLVPLARKDAREMIREIKGYAVLQGFRGQPPANLVALEDLILKVSGFIEKHPEIKELDLNPVFAYKDGAVAVDARITLQPEAELTN